MPTITTYTDLPSLGDPATFHTKADATLQWMTGTLVPELNALNATDFGFSGLLVSTQTFAASGTYTPATGVRYALIQIVGAGGGGGGADGDAAGQVGVGGGGGAGGLIELYQNVSATGYSATVTIGPGGTAGTGGAGANGGDGGDTTYNDGTTTWTAGGGKGGTTGSDQTSDRVMAGGLGGTLTGAGTQYSAPGEPGNTGFAIVSSISIGGRGGSTLFGGGGRSGDVHGSGNSEDGTDGLGYGAGGGGAAAQGDTANAQGGVGAGGFVIIYEFE